MNHRKVIPANGISFVAVRIPPRWELSHSAESPTPSGILTRIRISVAPKSTAKSTPAKAAARGVVNCCRLGPVACECEGLLGEDTDTSCQNQYQCAAGIGVAVGEAVGEQRERERIGVSGGFGRVDHSVGGGHRLVTRSGHEESEDQS